MLHDSRSLFTANCSSAPRRALISPGPPNPSCTTFQLPHHHPAATRPPKPRSSVTNSACCAPASFAAWPPACTSWLPFGLRVLKKAENIVREEMDRAGALELLMPTMQPAELWQESKRWEQYGPELLRVKDRHERQFCYGPMAHEEVITDYRPAGAAQL